MQSVLLALCSRPLIPLLSSLVLCIALVATAPIPQVNTNFEIYFESDDPDLQAYLKTNEEFRREANVAFLVRRSDGGQLDRSSLSAVAALTDRLKAHSGIQRVWSATEFTFVEPGDGELHLRQAVPSVSEVNLDQLLSDLSRDSNARASIVSIDRTAFIVAGRYFEKPPDARALVTETRAWRQIRNDIETQFPGVTILVTGLVPLEATLFEVMVRDGAILFPLCLLIVTAVYFFCLRTLSGFTGTVLLCLLSSASALSLACHFGTEFNDVNVAASLVILTVATSDCVHLVSRYLILNGRGQSAPKALSKALSSVFMPILLTTITTVAGFAFFQFSKSPPIQEFGFIASLGVSFAFLYTLVFMVPFISLVKPKAQGLPEFHKTIEAALSASQTWLNSKHRPALLFCGCLGLILAGVANRIDDDIVEYLDSSTEVRQAVRLAEHRLHGLQYIDVVIGHPEGVLTPTFITAADQLMEWMNSQPKVFDVVGLPRMLKEVQADLENSLPPTLPQTLTGVRELVFMLELVSAPGAMSDSLNFNRTQTKLRAYVGSMASGELIALDAKIRTRLAQFRLPPDTELTTTGPTLMFAYLGDKNVWSILQSSIAFFFIVVLILSLGLRSFRYGMLSLIPNIFPVLMVFGFWAVVDGTLNIASVATVTTIFGLIVDDTIHLLWHYMSARKRGTTGTAAITEIYSDLAPALTATTLCFSAGFAVFLFSNFEPNKDLGALILLGVGIAYLFDLVAFPPLLRRIGVRT